MTLRITGILSRSGLKRLALSVGLMGRLAYSYCMRVAEIGGAKSSAVLFFGKYFFKVCDA